MSRPIPPIIVWRDAVMDDLSLSWRAKVAAMPLVRHANLDGSNCVVGKGRAAAEMGVGRTTIHNGWEELQDRGYLVMGDLPATRRLHDGVPKTFTLPQRSLPTPRAGSEDDSLRHTNQLPAHGDPYHSKYHPPLREDAPPAALPAADALGCSMCAAPAVTYTDHHGKQYGLCRTHAHMTGVRLAGVQSNGAR